MAQVPPPQPQQQVSHGRGHARNICAYPHLRSVPKLQLSARVGHHVADAEHVWQPINLRRRGGRRDVAGTYSHGRVRDEMRMRSWRRREK
eukprot:333589-Pleurochrysis_carterae.AAC.1